MDKPRGLRYVSDKLLNWKRLKKGKYFRYIDEQGKQLSEQDRDRFQKLAIPPAWKKVRLGSSENGHILAVGFDAKGRKQYIYHPKWVEYNQQHKFDSLKKFGEILPPLRETVAGHMRQHDLTKERILATVVWLLEHTFIRVGNKAYARDNQSYGLTTMRTKHVDVTGQKIQFSFKGKSNVYHELAISHPRVATTVKACIELPGYELFQYLDSNGKRQPIDSADVNEYLKSITGEILSAKDFRTWGGTTLAGDSFFRLTEPEIDLPAEKVISQVIEEVSAHLGNTTAVCRKYYVHPKIIESYQGGQLGSHFAQIYGSPSMIIPGLTKEEYAAWTLL